MELAIFRMYFIYKLNSIDHVNKKWLKVICSMITDYAVPSYHYLSNHFKFD